MVRVVNRRAGLALRQPAEDSSEAAPFSSTLWVGQALTLSLVSRSVRQ
jgi:hypothetical protein